MNNMTFLNDFLPFYIVICDVIKNCKQLFVSNNWGSYYLHLHSQLNLRPTLISGCEFQCHYPSAL